MRLEQLLEPIDPSIVWIRGPAASEKQLGIGIATAGGIILTMRELQRGGCYPRYDQKQSAHLVAPA